METDLLPILNGKVVNLCTGEVSERKEHHYFTFEAPIDLSKVNADNEKEASQFILDLANNNQELARYLKTIMLYFLSGKTFDR